MSARYRKVGFFGQVLLVTVLTIWPICSRASWLSNISGVDWDVPSGTLRINQPHPENIPQALSHFPKDAINFLNPAGNALAFAIRQAKAQASGSARPMPSNIRSILTPFFPAEILDIVRYTTRNHAGTSIATVTLENGGNIDAITVDDIIVFNNDDGPNHPDLWAHELVHVTQYRNMGIDGFAAMYAGPGSKTMENDAYAYQDHVRQILASNPQNFQAIPNQFQDSTGGPIQPLTWADFNQAAKQVVQPANCVQMNQISLTALVV